MCVYYFYGIITKTVRRGGRTGACEDRVDEDISLNLLSHLCEICRSNTSIYYKLSDHGVAEIHLIHTLEGFSVLTLKFAFLFEKEFSTESFVCS